MQSPVLDTDPVSLNLSISGCRCAFVDLATSTRQGPVYTGRGGRQHQCTCKTACGSLQYIPGTCGVPQTPCPCPAKGAAHPEELLHLATHYSRTPYTHTRRNAWQGRAGPPLANAHASGFRYFHRLCLWAQIAGRFCWAQIAGLCCWAQILWPAFMRHGEATVSMYLVGVPCS